MNDLQDFHALALGLLDFFNDQPSPLVGTGGKLCVGLRKSFGLRKKEGVILDSVAGEDFSIFEETTLRLLEAVPALRGDPDLNAMNEGVTLLWLR